MEGQQFHRTDATTGEVLVALGRRFLAHDVPITPEESLQLLPMIAIVLESLRRTQFQMANQLGLAGHICEPPEATPITPLPPRSRA